MKTVLARFVPLLTLLGMLLWGAAAVADEPLMLVVMDPLAKPLSCPCVEGYAQRDYEQLAEFLQRRTGCEVEVVFSESLVEALDHKTDGRADLIVGKQSVVVADANTRGMALTPIARLTGKDGKVTQTGLIVVRSEDPAQSVSDLAGYRILFGPPECDEKHGAVLDLLQRAGVATPKTIETTVACSDGACKIIEWGDSEQGAAVISSYAEPLLEGCGTVQKGDLRVIGTTEPIPFITAFVNSALDQNARQQIELALREVGNDVEMLRALESLKGFVAIDKDTVAALKKN